MNKVGWLIGMFFACGVCSGQNLVPNPSFEDTVGCPNGTSQVAQAQYWSSYGNSSDYFNTCGIAGAGVPLNFVGYQIPRTGNAYMGEYKYANAIYEEFIGAQLIQPLSVGTKYFLSFYVNKANNHLCAINDFGLRFSNVAYSSTNPAPTDNFSHCHSTTIITDTINWVQIAGTFIADSAYQFIIIGNFYDTAHIGQINCPVPGPSYYYIDDVCVSTDSLTCNTIVGVNELKNEREFTLFPNPFSDKINITAKRNELVEVNFYDVTSRKLFNQSFTIPIAIGTTSINTEQLAKGIYIYEVRNKNGVIKKGKVVKE